MKKEIGQISKPQGVLKNSNAKYASKSKEKTFKFNVMNVNTNYNGVQNDHYYNPLSKSRKDKDRSNYMK